MTEPSPTWVYVQPPPKRNGRLALTIILAVVAVAIAIGVVVWLMWQDANRPTTDPSPTASASASATPTPTPSATATPTATPTPSATPTQVPSATPTPAPSSTVAPPVDDGPALEEFRGRVADRLRDQYTGLDIISESSGQEATSIADDLIADAQRLADEIPPASLQPTWRPAVNEYMSSLTALREALGGGSADGELADARAKVQALQDLVA